MTPEQQPETPRAPGESKQIDEICDRFEADWRAGMQPRLEVYLSEVAIALRPKLLSELLGAEWDLCRQANREVEIGSYLARFPDDGELIGRAYEEWSAEQAYAGSIFSLAITIRSSDERATYLKRACGDDVDLRQQLEQLLDLHFRGGGASDALLSELGNTRLDRPSVAGPGTQIGPYRLLQKIGAGGMGVVYVAEQCEPVVRRVALKIINPDLNDQSVIARFEAERQALALMDHVNIARVLDAGTTNTGRPYFVMELVTGVSITEFCDQNRLDIRARLQLFVLVCNALQHAHQKGIIHRDVKPSNVLVRMSDDRPVPKVIDFGVAKAVNERLTEKTLFTEFGQIVGTLQYMSPEQAQMGGVDVDTRSDIYALGVLLYELLTGTTPLELKRMGEVAFNEILWTICEEEPRKPSTALTESGDALPAISATRNTDPKRLGAIVRGDLDWIVMKSLEKDRVRRYQTVSGLAADLRRYLNDEPVEASPPSVLYKFKKLAHKHKRLLATATTIVAILVLSTIVTGWLAILKSVAESQARRAKEEQTELAEKNKQLAHDSQSAREDAERRLRIANASRLAALSNNVRGKMPQQSLLLAMEAIDATRAHGEPVVPLAHQSLIDALRGIGGIGLGKHEHIDTCAIGATGQWAVTCGREILLWDLTVQDHSTSFEVLLDGDCLRTFTVVSPDGRWFAAGISDNSIRLWDLTAQAPATSSRVLPASLSASFSRDGRWLATEGLDHSVHLWDLASERVSSTVLQGHSHAIAELLFTHDGSELISRSREGDRIIIWSMSDLSGKPRVIDDPLDPGDLSSIDRGGQWLLDFMGDEKKLWKLSARNLETPTIAVEAAGTWNTAISPNGRWLVATRSDNRLCYWDLHSDTIQEQSIGIVQPQVTPLAKGLFEDPAGAPQATGGTSTLHFSPNGRWLYKEEGEDLRLWAMNDESAEGPIGREFLLQGHTAHISRVVFSPDGRWLGTSSSDRTLRLWNLVSENPQLASAVLRGHEGHVSSLAFGPQGRWLLSGSSDQTARLWDLNALDAAMPATVVRWRTPRHEFTKMALSSNGRWLATAPDGKNEFQLRDLSLENPDESVYYLKEHDSPITTLSFSGNSRCLVTADKIGRLRVREINDDGSYLTSYVLDGQKCDWAHLSHDGRHVVCVDDLSWRHWDLQGQDPELVARVELSAPEFQPRGGGGLGSIANSLVSPDGQWLITHHYNTGSRETFPPRSASVMLWDLHSKQSASYITASHDREITAMAISPDSHWLITAGMDQKIRQWDLSAADPTHAPTIWVCPQAASSVVMSDDGRWLAGCAGALASGHLYISHEIYLWDLPKGGDPLVLASHEDKVHTVAFSEDSQFLASGSADNTVRLWQLNSDEPEVPYLVLRGHTSVVDAVHYSPEKRCFISRGDDTIRIWDLQLDRIMALAKRTEGRELTDTERKQFRLDH